MPTVLITGASRGIGREFATRYAGDGWRVYAACRNPDDLAPGVPDAPAGDVRCLRMDVTAPEQVADAARQVGREAIDLLINNAGIFGPRPYEFGQFDYQAWDQVMRVNALAPLRVAEAFADQVANSGQKRMAFLTSHMGSITDSSGGNTIYRSSKAALNAAVKCLALELAPRGVTAVVIHPGWVRTDMGGPGATLEVAESVRAMRRVFAGLTADDGGRFFNYDGTTLPW